MSEKIELKLFIDRSASSSKRAIINLNRIFREELFLRDRGTIEIIDIFEKPDIAKRENIIATPTLVRKLPFFSKKIIGDLSDKEKVLLGLDLDE